MNAPLKRLLGLQAALLFAGTVFAWSNAIPQILTFVDRYGTLWRFSEIALPNPLLTACLYGSLAFLAALYASVAIYQNALHRHERLLSYFLLFCVAFAGSVVLFEAAEFYHVIKPSLLVTCTPGVPPTQTPCFIGLLFFVAAWLTSSRALKHICRDLVE